uniref:SRA stem-loop interacting RNA binding protein n=1 Tax=Nothoprocta perdicaria TaxID=30464 RepID=A0A8C7EF51_NOTPE
HHAQALKGVEALSLRSVGLTGISKRWIIWELRDYFAQFGAVQRCQLPFDRDTGFHKRYGWIKFSSPEDVQNVFQKDSHILEGAKVTDALILPSPGNTNCPTSFR